MITFRFHLERDSPIPVSAMTPVVNLTYTSAILFITINTV